MRWFVLSTSDMASWLRFLKRINWQAFQQRRVGTILILGIFLSIISLSLLLFQALFPSASSLPQPLLPVVRISSQSLEPITPIFSYPGLDSRKVALGEKLFHETQLSHNNQISCASCHNLQQGGTDQLPHSVGINGQISFMNSPTVFNSGLNFKQFWDGRAATLEKQIDGPVLNPQEMGSTWTEVIAKLRTDQQYNQSFRQIYNSDIQPEMIKDAIATFERSLNTPNSRFDRLLKGEKLAITAAEKAGYALFKSYGCVACHQGVNMGGNMFQSMGVMADYFANRGHINQADYGRFNLTKDPRDRYVFKVPSLRNIALTAPYFHDGQIQTLPEAVKLMGKYQLGIDIPSQDVVLIWQFLQTLTGEYRGESL